jgi:two-component system response regulator HydG
LRTLASLQVRPRRNREFGHYMATAMFWEHHDDPFDLLIGESAPMRHLKETIRRVATTGSHVVLRGEPGVGKELVARIVHQRSGRVGPFNAINLGAIPKFKIAECLFGSEPPSHDCSESCAGRFEQAHLGTLFVVEIVETPKSLRAPFADVVRTKQLRRLRSQVTREADVRVVAAVSDPSDRLPNPIADALSGVVIHIPPLRERGTDALLIARAFLEQMHEGQRFSAEAERRLSMVDLPGNVRQLQNVVERAAVITDGAVIPASALLVHRGRR